MSVKAGVTAPGWTRRYDGKRLNWTGYIAVCSSSASIRRLPASGGKKWETGKNANEINVTQQQQSSCSISSSVVS
jgi:hypothetical protein